MTTPEAAGRVTLRTEAGVAWITFDRPAARNAMTWAMYEQLSGICQQLQQDHSVRVAVFRGAGGQAFVAGTDIEQFLAFKSGDDGVAYERRIEAGIVEMCSLPMPTVAVVEGFAVGGGLLLATCCDFRLATPDAQFGVPIARTLGNCLSLENLARLRSAWGPQRMRRMLMLAELLGAPEALACGYLHAVAEPAELDAATGKLVQQLAALAPVTQRVSKAGLQRLQMHEVPPEGSGDDLIRAAYGSADFAEGVSAFVGKRRPAWKGC
ncbi:MAG: enoyl-CoA hydratase/isomerase family protein [Serpentinimonas sp.]|jgi:enoyl-CoA hydratase/carnithine racemase|nr:enoyl-CoA hydratase/isomerase family protein [Serpentinimonas sp.]